MKNARSLLLLLSILILTLLACGMSAPGTSEVEKQDWQTHWKNVAAKENGTEQDWLASLTWRSEAGALILNENPLMDRCFTNSAEAIDMAVSGRYDSVNEQGIPTGSVETQALLNALVVNESYPDLSECQRLVTKVANDISAYRMGNIDRANKLWEDKRALDTLYRGEIGQAFATELLQFAGEEFMKTKLAQHFAPPKIWYPTFNLEAFVTDKNKCADFEADFPGQAKWLNSTDQCLLIADAAYAKIFDPILTSDAFRANNTGVDDFDPFGGFQTTPTVEP